MEPNRERLGNRSNRAKLNKSTKKNDDYRVERKPSWKY
jgi:hypothetical protein